MNLRVYVVLLLCCAWLLLLVQCSPLGNNAQRVVNLTDWRAHRRQKRFILFEHAGICKLVTGIAFPVNLGEKREWRQLVMTMNLQYQFPVPPRPIYWWERWQDRKMPTAPFVTNAGAVAADAIGDDAKRIPPPPPLSTDDAQLFLYQFAEQLMTRRQMQGRACLLRAICENAQVHQQHGLFGELLHRALIPHHTLDAHYVDAHRMGRHGVHCHQVYAEAKHCLLDAYLHVTEDYGGQTLRR